MISGPPPPQPETSGSSVPCTSRAVSSHSIWQHLSCLFSRWISPARSSVHRDGADTTKNHIRDGFTTRFFLTHPITMWNVLNYTSFVLPAVVALPVWYWVRKRSRNTLPYPPGPGGYPLVGNLLDFPLGIPLWEGLSDLARKHGRILPSDRHCKLGY